MRGNTTRAVIDQHHCNFESAHTWQHTEPMPRYALDGELWEITRSGAALEITTTPRGGKPKATTRKFVSADAADKLMAKLIAEHERDGYQLCDDQPAPEPEPEFESSPIYARSPALEAVIAAAPYDPSGYLVYADWLQARGDPRGELIALQISELTEQRDVEAAITALVKRHRASLYGALAAGRTMPKHREPPLIWRFGFIHRVELEREAKGRPIAPILEAVLQHPSGRLVTELVLRSDDPGDLRAALAVLVRLVPPALRVLELASRAAIGDLAAVLATASRLERLSVKVRSRRRVSPGLDRDAGRSVANHVPSSVSRLELRCGTGGVELEDLGPLFVRADLTSLTHLRIRDARFADALVPALLAAPFARQLVVLDLGMCELTDATARLLVAHVPELPALVELWLTRGRMSKLALDLLTAAVPHVVDLAREPIDATLEQINRARYGSVWE